MPDYGEASINSGAMHGLLRFPGFKVPPPSAALLQKTGRSVFEVRLPAKTVAKTASTRSNALVSLIQVNDRQYGLSSPATCARPSPLASTTLAPRRSATAPHPSSQALPTGKGRTKQQNLEKLIPVIICDGDSQACLHNPMQMQLLPEGGRARWRARSWSQPYF